MRALFLFFITLCTTPIFAQNVTVIGVGRLGLCLALCLEKAGFNVLGVDVSQDYITSLNSRTFHSSEPMVQEYLQTCTNFKATTSLEEGLAFSNIYLIAAPTNSIQGIESYDHSIISHILTGINNAQVEHKHIVICSTIFPGYIENTANELIRDCIDTDISYNPSFIAQGTIIQGLCFPDVVLIGEGSKDAGILLEEMQKKIFLNTPYIAKMTVPSAEITKLALNCFITAKIGFANLIADIADETQGADKYAILKAIGQDKRVGAYCLIPGYGFGGPCFPRDNRALGNYAKLKGINPISLLATDEINKNHSIYMAEKMLETNLPYYVFEDVSYKPNCPVPIIEESQKLAVAYFLAKAGKEVLIRDREEVIQSVQKLHGDLFYYEIVK